MVIVLFLEVRIFFFSSCSALLTFCATILISVATSLTPGLIQVLAGFGWLVLDYGLIPAGTKPVGKVNYPIASADFLYQHAYFFKCLITRNISLFLCFFMVIWSKY